MSINVKDAIQAIREMAPIINFEEDFLTIVAAEETIAAKEAKRRKELEEINSKLKSTAKALEAARVSSTRPNNVPSAAAHAAKLNELDGNRFLLGKAISDEEGLVGSREAELTKLKEEARRLENYDPATEHDKALDGTVLRLQIFKGMGFEPVVDREGNLTKMLIRGESDDVHCMEFTDGRSTFQQTQDLWRLASS
ncbi:hypothetical protein AX16_002830 [Volvariella volvacea WC 439]|nr:hypothetical protein AX16_002830 [Volvariella volvacea WC 439]